MALNCTLVDIDSMLYTSVQDTYFYKVIFGTKFRFSENQSTLRFHYPYWAPSFLLRSRHYDLDNNVVFKPSFDECFREKNTAHCLLKKLQTKFFYLIISHFACWIFLPKRFCQIKPFKITNITLHHRLQVFCRFIFSAISLFLH